MISISSVQYASGLRIDLDALSQLCQKQKILFCVDAIQSLGAVPFDQTKIQADFIVADGHKWMMAAEGLALLYIKKDQQNQLKLTQFGWHMIKDKGNYSASEWEPANDGTRFECGSPNMLGIHTLNASLGFIHKVGIKTIASELDKRMSYLTGQLNKINGLTILSPIDKALRGGIITFKIENTDGVTTDIKKIINPIINKTGVNQAGAMYTFPKLVTQSCMLFVLKLRRITMKL